MDTDIYLFDIATQTVTRRLTNNDDAQDGIPVWSPFGDKIVYYRGAGSQYHLWIINVDGTGGDDLMRGRPGLSLDPNWR
jgi:Tol biopolymer transport system component